MVYIAFLALLITIFFIMFFSHSNVHASPPTGVVEITVENTRFSPNGDMIKDVTLVNVVANESQTLYVNIYNSSMQMVYQGLPLSEVTLGNYTGSWNGTNSFDWSVVPDGTYTIYVTSSADGNVFNESAFTNGTVIVDTKAPFVPFVDYSHSLITEANIWEIFYVNVTYNEEMDTNGSPAINFINPALTGTLSFSGDFWYSTTIYHAEYTILDNNEEKFDVDIQVSNATDLGGNKQIMNITYDTFVVDTKAPNVISVIVSDPVITEVDTGGMFNLIVAFDEPMNILIDPIIVFENPTLTTTLTPTTRDWFSNIEFRQNYSVSDDNVEISNIDVNVTLGQDVAGNVMSYYISLDKLDVDTVAPTVVTVIISDQIITDRDAGILWVNCSFSEIMNDSFQPVITFNPDVSISGTLNFQNGVWNADRDWYNASYLIADVDEKQLDVDVNVSNARDIAGNLQRPNPTTMVDKFHVNTFNPTVQNVMISDNFITDLDVMGVLGIIIEFSEPMNTSMNPILTFDPDVIGSGSLFFFSSSWVNSTHYRENYNILDSNEEHLNVNITVDSARNVIGNPQELYIEIYALNIDTKSPIIDVVVSQENTPASVGEWINITVTTDTDVLIVDVDLASAGFSGQMDNQILTWSGVYWYYNFTVVDGIYDGTNTINVDAQDDAGNLGNNNTESADWDEIAPTVVVTINQQSAQAGIGEWINITAITDVDSIIVDADLASAGFTGQLDNQILTWSGVYWYYNFTVVAGIYDGTNTINVDTQDDAGNLGNNNTESADWDEVAPPVNIIVNQGSFPAGINEWVNITVTTDADVVNVVGDLSAFGGQVVSQIFIGSGADWYYNFTIQPGTLDCLGAINVTVTDDVGNSNYDETKTINVDEEAPALTVTVAQENSPAKVGDWINITATILGDDATGVFVDLGALTGQIDNTAMQYNVLDSTWYYLFVVITGTLDSSYIVINVVALDDAGNTASDNTQNVNVDEEAPTPTVSVTQESTSAGIGDWINVTTIIQGDDATSVNVDLGIFKGQMDNTPMEYIVASSTWYYVFNLVAGQLDNASIVINVDATDDAGNAASDNSQTANADEAVPTAEVTVLQKSAVTGIGGWVKITVVTDPDVTLVSADLATAGFTRQIDDQLLMKVSYNSWQYNFTISPGYTDASAGVSVNVDVLDDAGNQNLKHGTIYFDEVYPEPLEVEVTTGAIGTNPVKIGDWINVTVDMDEHVDIVSMYVDANGIFYNESIIHRIGNIWYLNTTIAEGTADGFVSFTIAVIDDANNLNDTKYDVVDLDNVNPYPSTISIFSNSILAKANEWINITIDMGVHSDTSLIYVDAPGVFSSVLITEHVGTLWYLNTSVPIGTTDGEVNITVTIHDDAGNQVERSTSYLVDNRLPSQPSRGIPLWVIILIGCVVAVAVGLGAIAVTEIGHYSFFFFIYFLYTRIKREYILDNFTRGRIYGYVEANPGEHFNAIKRALGLKNGSLAYHIRTLEREGYIISKRDRGYTRFYPKSIKLPKRNIRELIPLQRDIVGIVKNNPGISQRGIADQLDISYQLVHYHIKVLQGADYLYLEKDAKQSYCYDIESFQEGSGLE